MLMMATAIHNIQNRKLPMTVGICFKNTNGIVKSSIKRNRNHPAQHPKDFFIGDPNKDRLSVSVHSMPGQAPVIQNRRACRSC